MLQKYESNYRAKKFHETKHFILELAISNCSKSLFPFRNANLEKSFFLKKTNLV